MASNSIKMRSGKFTGWHMFALMALFFGVVIAVNVTMAVLAGRSWTGLVVKNSYVASQHFNAELREAKRQQARGWRSQLSYAEGKISFTLHDRKGKAVELDDLRAKIGRPAAEIDDRVVSLKHIANGKYTAAVQLAAGHWSIQIVGGRNEMAYRRDARLFVNSRK